MLVVVFTAVNQTILICDADPVTAIWICSGVESTRAHEIARVIAMDKRRCIRWREQSTKKARAGNFFFFLTKLLRSFANDVNKLHHHCAEDTTASLNSCTAR